MPLVGPLFSYLGPHVTMVAFDDPTLHQHRPTKPHKYGPGIAPDDARQNQAGTPAAMIVAVNVFHLWKDEAPVSGPRLLFYLPSRGW